MYSPNPTDTPIKVYSLGTFVDGLMDNIDKYIKLIHEEDNWEWFTNLWENIANEEKWYKFVVMLRPSMSFTQWDIAWQWRIINHEDINQAVLELANALVGWY